MLPTRMRNIFRPIHIFLIGAQRRIHAAGEKECPTALRTRIEQNHARRLAQSGFMQNHFSIVQEHRRTIVVVIFFLNKTLITCCLVEKLRTIFTPIIFVESLSSRPHLSHIHTICLGVSLAILKQAAAQMVVHFCIGFVRIIQLGRIERIARRLFEITQSIFVGDIMPIRSELPFIVRKVDGIGKISSIRQKKFCLTTASFVAIHTFCKNGIAFVKAGRSVIQCRQSFGLFSYQEMQSAENTFGRSLILCHMTSFVPNQSTRPIQRRRQRGRWNGKKLHASWRPGHHSIGIGRIGMQKHRYGTSRQFSSQTRQRLGHFRLYLSRIMIGQ